MELVTTAFNNLPIVIFASAVAIFIKQKLFDFLSLEFVKQTLKTVFGLTPRETGEIIIVLAKQIAIIVKNSFALIITSVKSIIQFLSFIIPEKITQLLGDIFSVTGDIVIFGYIGEFVGEMFVKFFTGLAKLIRLIFHLIPQLFTFLETLVSVFYKLGQGLYVILAVLNKSVETAQSVWYWFQDPPVSNRIIIIVTILLMSFVSMSAVKCIIWAKKKIE